ncbi:MAG: cysteine hydrolase [Ardenticatenaceae bacterium]|nr:cysteine hydrolase [Ardenticatenaceae bacterium]
MSSLSDYEWWPFELEFEIDRHRMALLCVDMQYLYAHPDWGVGKWAKRNGLEQQLYYRFEQIASIIPNIQRLQEGCRGLGIPVIHIRVASMTGDGRDCNKEIRGSAKGLFVAAVDSKEAQFLEDLRPLPGEIVITKTSFSAFNSTGIDQTLRNLGVESLIVTGVATHACVELTARDAADRGYWVIIAFDGCATNSGQLQQETLARLDGGTIAVKMTEEILRLLAEPDPASVRGSRASP